MVHDQRSALSTYVSSLLSAGRVVFAGGEAAKALGVPRGAFLDAAERLQKRGHLLNPRQDFYVIVPPQFATWGAPPPPWYIDALMKHESQPYYVGLLKAAELHGATHQAVMEFQVVTAKRLPKIRAGRNLIVFYYRKNMEAVAAGVAERKTDTGTMRVSDPALTALDLLRYPRAAGGLDNVATVLTDLAPSIDGDQLAALSAAAERPVVQRLGHLLDRLGQEGLTAPLHAALQARGGEAWTELDRKEAADPDFAPPPLERDSRWRVIVRRAPEIDE
ncbi:type IV toxin-antitoxin system AbiEi family antitoxin domain-containing protein [Mesorhizobium sp. ASY16-5R]|uniref:type IV toxin-antitoxin system AbiEi family antitoxin domain-containing protein n=1 Tax=Mesorhizobium sp. ASY16-5R TaxID=3445772 RepID=UPI003F9FD2D5